MHGGGLLTVLWLLDLFGVPQAAKHSSTFNGKPLIMKWYTPKAPLSPSSPYSHLPRLTPSQTDQQSAPSSSLSLSLINTSTVTPSDGQVSAPSLSPAPRFCARCGVNIALVILGGAIYSIKWTCGHVHVYTLYTVLAPGDHTYSGHTHTNEARPGGAPPCGGR